jgi:hypothetical protein
MFTNENLELLALFDRDLALSELAKSKNMTVEKFSLGKRNQTTLVCPFPLSRVGLV